MPVVAGFLSGVPRQGRVGVGYSTVFGVERRAGGRAVARRRATLDAAISEIQAHDGRRLGGAAQASCSSSCSSRATADEADFVRRLFTGELRQGALAGLMVDAIAKAAGVPADLARRAFMLSGDLTRTAEIALARRRGRACARSASSSSGRSCRCSPRPPRASPTRSRASSSSSVEWKLDGIRIQIHRRGDEVRVYTRNLNDITGALPGIVDAARALPVQQAVFDGEAIWMTRRRPGAVPGHGRADRLRRAAGRGRHVPLRRAAPRRRGPARRAARASARRGSRRSRRSSRCRGVLTSDAGRGAARARRGAARRPRGRRRQGRVVAVRRRPPRQGVAQGEAGAHVRPRRARRGVGPRAPAGLALEPPPRRARRRERRVRHGRQDASRA